MEFNLSALVSLKNNLINLNNKKLRRDNKFLKLTKNLKIVMSIIRILIKMVLHLKI